MFDGGTRLCLRLITSTSLQIARAAFSAAGWSEAVSVADGHYRTNAWKQLARRVVAEEPVCHWGFEGCTGRSTQGDHLDPNGPLWRSNVVGSCQSCNLKRRRKPGGRKPPPPPRIPPQAGVW